MCLPCALNKDGTSVCWSYSALFTLNTRTRQFIRCRVTAIQKRTQINQENENICDRRLEFFRLFVKSSNTVILKSQVFAKINYEILSD